MALMRTSRSLTITLPSERMPESACFSICYSFDVALNSVIFYHSAVILLVEGEMINTFTCCA